MIADLIKKLTDDERATLSERIAQNNNQIYQFIGAFLANPDISKEEVETRFNLSSNTYFKKLTQAKDEIYDVIKTHMRHSYDDLLLPNILYRRGLEVHASKLRLKLEDEYSKQGWWAVLNELYNIELIVQYARCDIDRIKETKTKLLANMERLAAYTRVDKELILQMAIIEKGALKEKEFAGYESRMAVLLAEAETVGHHIPIFNALHCYYMFYTKYMVNKDKALKIIADVGHFIDQYSDSLIPYTRNAALLNRLSFYVTFELETDAAVFFDDVAKAISKHGMLYDIQAMLNYCTYYFMKRDIKKFQDYYDLFMKIDIDRTFAYNVAYIRALRAYLLGDSKEFYTHQNEFYQMEDSREYIEYNLTLRYLEKMLLLKEDNLALAQSKLDATIKFINRNLTKTRIDIEKNNLDIIKSLIKRKKPKEPVDPVYRLTSMLYKDALGS